MKVYFEGTGEGNAIGAFTELGNAATAAGCTVMVENPLTLATGRGRFFIDAPQVDSPEDAIAVTRALLDQIPGADEAFTLSPGQE